MEEDRRWTHIMLIQEREQIKEAVQYYIKNEAKSRDHRQLTLSNINHTMNWEMKLRHARSNRNECCIYTSMQL